MLKEKHDNALDWKKKLNELDSLPGEQWDKNLAWEKLHDRFRVKPRSKKIVYWATTVAACLLLSLGMQWLSQNKEEGIVTNKVKKTIDKLTPVQNPTIIKNHSVGIASALVKKENDTHSIQEKKKSIAKVPVEQAPIEANSNLLIDSIPDEKNNIVAATDTASVLIATIPAKKLRVVHLNELGKPVEEKIRLAHAPGSFRGRFTQDAFSGYSPNISNDNSLKIKLSPHN